MRLGIYKSNDRGENWYAINQGIKANQVYDSVISPSGKLLVGSESGVYLRNQGGSWERINTNQPEAVAFSPDNENIIYAGWEGGFGKSIDSGQNWSLVNIPSNEENSVFSIILSPEDPETLYLGVYYSSGNKGEIYKSVDGGETIRLVKSLEVPVNVVQLSPNNPHVVYAGSGMFYTVVVWVSDSQSATELFHSRDGLYDRGMRKNVKTFNNMEIGTVLKLAYIYD